MSTAKRDPRHFDRIIKIADAAVTANTIKRIKDTGDFSDEVAAEFEEERIKAEKLAKREAGYLLCSARAFANKPAK